MRSIQNKYCESTNRNKMPQWTKEQLQEAIHKVKAKQLSLNKAAQMFGIPVSTLHSHLHEGPSKVGAGRPTTLTYEEEREIVYICQVRVLLVQNIYL